MVVPGSLELFDLLGWAESIEDARLRKPLVHAVQNAGRAQSCRADLVIAQHCCEAFSQLEAIGALMSLVHRQTSANALLMQAVLLYSRATATGGGRGERGSVSIHDRLPSELRQSHAEILAIRDRVQAHVHANEAIGDQIWHQEAVYALVEGIHWQPAAATRRIQTDPQLISKLRNLLPNADRLILETFHKRLAKLAKLMSENVKTLDNLAQYPFDAVAFFGSEIDAAKALEGRLRGTSFGIIDRQNNAPGR